MRLPLHPIPRNVDPSDLPTAVWLPNRSSAYLPNCYQGSPSEMVQAMVQDMNPSMGVDDGIDWLCKFLSENRDISITLPNELPPETRAHLFLVALLCAGVAEPMARA
jgi:hypothetical protein